MIGRTGSLRLAATLLAAVGGIGFAHAQQPAVLMQDGGAPRALPFSVGERLEYEVRFGPIRVGSGSMAVERVDTIRNREAWYTQFRIKGGTFLYKVDDLTESWIDTRSLTSLRLKQLYHEGGRKRDVVFDMFPERATYSEKGEPELKSVSLPLDEGSFLYFVRTIPLEVGKTYDFDRYFKPDRNPVRLKVLRKEQVRVPAGTFNAIVVQPIIKTTGIFSENGEAQVWLADDPSRMMLQMKSNLSFGSINLYLKSFRLGQPATARTSGGAPGSASR